MRKGGQISLQLRIKRALTLFLFAICCTLTLAPQVVQGKPEKQVILIMADYLDLTDLQSKEAPYLQQAVRTGTIGLMNTNTAHSSRTSPHTHATISAGSPAIAGTSHVFTYPALEQIDGEAAGSIYQRYSGKTTTSTDLLVLNWPQIQQANQNLRQPIPAPGLLGEKLKEAGLTVAILGNSDTPSTKHRPAGLIACDYNGIIPQGKVGDDIVIPSEGFLLFRTDYKELLKETLNALSTASLIVIDTGDLFRLETTRHYGFNDIVLKERAAIIQNINDFYRGLSEAVDMDQTLLILASTTPSPVQIQQKNFLVPMVMSNNHLTPGLLYSNTTRRPGLVTNTDLTATILSFLGIEPSPHMTGQSIVGVPFKKEEDPIAYLTEVNKEMLFTYQSRPQIIKPYIGLQIATILGVIPLSLYAHKIIPYYRYLLALITAYPAALMLVELFPHQTLIAYTIVSILLAVLLVLLCTKVFSDKSIKPFILLSAITAALIIFDMIAGSTLMKQSLLGYDPIAGARYYGIGNEYMGVLVGSSLMGFGVILRQQKAPISIVLFIVYFGLLTWLMFSADFGTNLGGTITVLVAFGYWFWRWQKETLKRNLFFCLPLSLIMIAMIVTMGLGFYQDRPSHIGRTVQLIRQEGMHELLYIIARKLAMNLKLIRYTPWARVFLAALLAVGVLLFKPAGFMKRLYRMRRPVYEALISILLGSITALIWNDSGIVAAATTMIFGVYPLISLALDEVKIS